MTCDQGYLSDGTGCRILCHQSRAPGLKAALLAKERGTTTAIIVSIWN